MHLDQIAANVKTAAWELVEKAQLKPGQILVLGCSTSEVLGKKIGKGSSTEVARAILDPLLELTEKRRLFLAVQCCEHLNRALVVEAPLAQSYNLEEVLAYPVPGAGGATAALAMDIFREPVLVERIQGQAGLDVGQTLIGMHLRPVVVPVRLSVDRIGEACLTAARTRPRLIGGNRTVYVKPGMPLPGPEK